MRMLLVPMLAVGFVCALALGWHEPTIGAESCVVHAAYGFHLTAPRDSNAGCPGSVPVDSGGHDENRR